jgi:hypothetical protein
MKTIGNRASAIFAGVLLFVTSLSSGQSTLRNSTTSESEAIRPYKVNIPEEDLMDLQRRIRATRWPDKETVTDQSQGVRLESIQRLVAYWDKGYNWRKAEAKLNALPQFMTTIDGLDIHFIHVRSRQKMRCLLSLRMAGPALYSNF